MNHLCIKWPTPALLLLLIATLSAIVVFDGACRCCLFVEGFSVAAARAVVKPSPLPPLELPATAERCAPSDTPPSSLLSDRCIQRRHVQSPSLFMSNNDLDESTASPSTNDSTTTSSTPSATSTQPAEIVESSLTSSQITSIQKHMHLGTKLRNLQTQLKSNAASFKPENLSKLGLTALLSYGFVSNVSGVVAVSCAWFIFSKKFGVSPIAPGQKPAFLALYAGFTIALNLLRPFRFALSMAITPTFEKIRKYIQRKFGVSAKMSAVWMAVGINLFGTCTLMGVGVGLASLLSGVPVWAR
ncbi:predicted protein [Thalassiosira pseudonana CCMP1335]|uniref:Uncharacterized protein n=1 Tax=Thalassiosira pseudonana TaxID=35128 RepID=B8LEI8_THAPS|nr:predicted protein [Thalassiosira pseudonana CCMP1335]EED86266.1 predicted protein [Thalassiosira pseudonana CCMP1335]|eukprot:g13126.t1 g13126   contig70:75039-76267(-)